MSTTPSSVELFRRLCWNGTIPLEVKLNQNELHSFIPSHQSVVDTFFICPPRCSYLPLIYQTIKKDFLSLNFNEDQLNSISDDQIWFEAVESDESSSGTACKWHWPIGLLYDYFIYTSPLSSSNISNKHINPLPTPPLKLILHIKTQLPIDKLFTSCSVESCRQSFMGSIKESEFVRWGHVKRITTLRKGETEELWQGVEKHDFETYFKIASKLLPIPNSEIDIEQPKSVAIKLILPDGIILQDLRSPAITLREYLSSTIPLLFPSNSTKYPQLAFPVLHGIRLPLDSNIGWLGGCLTSADGFLRICIVLYT